jgi:RimJ/RimL family protein N-acetyltransferase
VSERVRLRPVVDADLEVFFQQQLDPDANWMAAFTADDPSDRRAFDERWAGILGDGVSRRAMTVLFDERVAGHIVCFERFENREVGYWLGKEFWGKGVASAALAQYLATIPERPLHARAASDNAGSIRVLENCGFRVSHYERAYANGRRAEIQEAVFVLE